MKKSILILGFVAIATVNTAMIPLPISEAGYHVFRDPTLDITEDTKAVVRPYNTDIYITEDNNPDTIRSKRHFGANIYAGGYGGVGYPGAFDGPTFGIPVGSTFGRPSGPIGGGGGFGGLGGYGGLGGGFSGSTAQSSSSAFGTGGGFWG